MARLLTCGWEAGSINEAKASNNQVGTVTLDTVNQRSGAAALKLAAGGVAHVGPFRGDALNLPAYARVYAKVSGAPSSENFVFGFTLGAGTTSGGVMAMMGPDRMLRLKVWSGTLYVQQGSPSVALTDTSKWYRIEVYARPLTATTVDAALYLDGVLVASANGIATASWTGASQIVFMCPAGVTDGILFDDLAVNDATGTAHNTYPGEGKAFLLKPLADSAKGTGWTNDAATTTNFFDATDNIDGVADTTAGTGTRQIRNAASAANSAYDASVTDYATAGLIASDIIALVQPIVCTAAPVTTQAKLGTVGVVSNPVGTMGSLNERGTAGAFWAGTAGGVSPAGWKWSWGPAVSSPTVTLATRPVVRINQVTASTRIAVVDFLGMYVETRPPQPKIGHSPTSLAFEVSQGDTNPPGQTVSITNSGDAGTTLNWTASDDASWLTVTTSGTAPSTLIATVNPTGLAPGTYNGTITIVATGSSNTPQTIPVTLNVLPMPVSNNAEGGTDLATITTGNSGGISGDAFDVVMIGGTGTAIFASDQKAHGALSYKLIQASGTTSSLYLLWRTGQQSRLFGRAYCRINSVMSGDLIHFFNGVPAYASNRLLAGINVVTGKIAIRIGTGPTTDTTVATSTNTLVRDSWFRLEWDFSFSTTAANLVVKIFSSPDSTTPIETVTASDQALRFATADRLLFGTGVEGVANVNAAIWFDDLNVNTNGFPGPSNTPYDLVVDADNPVSHWKLGASTTAARDRKNRTYLTSSVASPTTTGIVANNSDDLANSFVGGQDQIFQIAEAPGVGTPYNTPAFSIEAWIKLSTLGTTGLWNFVNRIQFLMGVGGIEQKFWFFASGPNISGGIPVVGQIYHVVGVHDGSNDILYLNGVEIARAANTVSPTNTVSAPIISSGPSSAPDGTIDEVAWYNTALSPERVLAHYEAGKFEVPTPYDLVVDVDNPVSHWKLGKADKAYDRMEVRDLPSRSNPTTVSGIVANNDNDLAINLDSSLGQGFGRGATVGDGVPYNTAAWAAEMWVRPASLASMWLFLGPAMSIYLFTNRVSLRVYDAASVSHEVVYNTPLPVDVVSHLVATHDGTTAILYINGIECARALSSGQSNDPDEGPMIGYYFGNGTTPFNGVVDEVAWYNTALSPARVLAHYQAGIPTVPSANKLVSVV